MQCVESKKSQRSNEAVKVTYFGSIANIVLTAVKFAAGIFGGSKAMLADAVHSLSDFASDIVVIISFIIAKQPEDRSHDYGHGKFETLAAVIIGILLFFVGGGLLISGIKSIIDYLNGAVISRPRFIALAAAGLSIVVKEILFQYTKKKSKDLKSSTLLANAWHHRSDALSSVGALIGIGGAIFLGEKWRILDPAAGVIVSIFILKAAFDIVLSNVNELMEASLSDEIEIEILDTIKSVKGANFPHRLRTRKIGDSIAIDVHIMVNPNLTIVEGHNISTAVEKKLEEKYGEDSFISTHIEPLPEKE